MILHLNTKKLLIIFAIGNILLFGGYLFGLNSLIDLNAQVAEVSAQVSSFSITNENLSSLQSALASAEEGMRQIDEYYIARDGAVDFISIIESIAKSRSITLSIDSVDTADIDKDTKEFQERLNLRLKTEGTWAETEQFLELLENLPYNVYIDEAELIKLDSVAAPGSPKPTINRWKGEFKVVALKLK